MKKFVTAVAALSCALSGTAYAADTDTGPRVFQAKGPWAADYADDYCRLARTFTNGPDEISLAIDRIQPGLTTRMIVSGDSVKLYRRAKMLGYRYLPSGDDRQTLLLRSETASGGQYLVLYPMMMAASPKPGTPPGPPPPYSRDNELAYADGVNGLILTEGTTQPIEIDTGDLKPVFAALQKCTDDLVKTWGVDPEKDKTATRMVLPNGSTSKWLPSGTIGFADFAKLSGGSNQIRLMVDATGKPTDCKVHYQTLDQATNDKICKALMENAKFQPALDAGGQAFASYYTTSPMLLFGPPKGRGRR